MADQSDVQIIVSKLYGPNGIISGFVRCDIRRFSAITLLFETPDGRSGRAHLSPVHGDERKEGFTDIEIEHAVCSNVLWNSPLKRVEEIDDAFGAGYYALYRTADLQ